MAGRDGEEPKEGVDFKWVKAENSNAMVRKFFTKADKAAAKAPAKAAPKKAKPAAKAAPKASPKPKAKPETRGQESKTVTDKAAKIPVDTKPTSATRTRANELGMGGKDKPKEESRSAAAMAAMGALGAATMASGRKPKPPAKTSTSIPTPRVTPSNEGVLRQVSERAKQVRAEALAKRISAADKADKPASKTSTKGKKRAGSGGRGGGSLMAPIMRHFDDINERLPRLAKGGMVKGKNK